MMPVTAVRLRMPLSSMAMGPRVELRALQRVLSGTWPRGRSGTLEGRDAHLMVIGPGHELRDVMTMVAAAVWPGGPDPEGVRGAAAVSSSTALLEPLEDDRDSPVLLCQPLDVLAVARLSVARLDSPREDLDLALLHCQRRLELRDAACHR